MDVAHAARAALSGRDVQVHVIGGERSDDELVQFLLEGGEDTDVRLPDVSTIPSGRQYDDWRTEMMGLRSAITAKQVHPAQSSHHEPFCAFRRPRRVHPDQPW